ncbi:MAG: S41 family peptidase [Bacteroidota bacterium]|nr:S41 family peptidase [Bacteroidota bacterium]
MGNRQSGIGNRQLAKDCMHVKKFLPLAYCLLPIACCLLLAGCGSGRSSFSPYKKYSPEQLQKDYSVYRDVLEEAHPGLYWYTPKDSMNYYFDWGKQQLKDSMTEPEFRKVLTYVTAKVNCGHTSVRNSKAYSKYMDTVAIWRIFPLSMKIWGGTTAQEDTMVVAANLNRKDSILSRGTIITKINGKTTREIVDTLFDYLSTDGYNRTHKFQTLSNRGFFGSLYSYILGYSARYAIEYLDSNGQTRSVSIPIYYPSLDTATRASIIPVTRVPQPSRKERKQRRLNSVRLLKIDTANHTAFMDLGSFGRGYKLKSFFRRSFRALKKHDIGHFIIDVRGNGGGSVTNSTNLSRYLSNHKFKVSDTLYAIAKRKKYSRYIQNDFLNRLFMTFFTKRRHDGYYHFRYFEKHYFKPKKRNHFDGKTYILTGGNSFSATTLFISSVKGQDNVTVVGEETGGGAYGNTAWLIPDVTLPETGVRFRLPLFRLVINKDIPKNGLGVQPEVEAKPTVEAIRQGADYKLDKVMELIKKDKERKE